MPEGKLMVRNYRHSQTILNHRLVGIINCCSLALTSTRERVEDDNEAGEGTHKFSKVLTGTICLKHKLAVPCAFMMPMGRSNVTLGNGGT